MDYIEMFHVAYVDVDSTDVVQVAARSFDRRLDVFADLAGLDLDIADARNRKKAEASLTHEYYQLPAALAEAKVLIDRRLAARR